MKNRYLLLFLVFLVKPVCLLADTTFVSGTIINETWSLSNSPYCVQDEIFVAGLTIEKGVEVVFLGSFTFEVNGVINANGSEDMPVIFTKIDSITGWNGISFQNTPPGSNLKWCIIEYSLNSGIRILDSSPLVEDCIIRKNKSGNHGGGLKISNSISETLYFKNCMIDSNTVSTNYTDPSSNGAGVYVHSEISPVEFVNCTISENYAYRSDGNVYGGGVWSSGNVDFIESTIKNNEVFANNLIPGGTNYGRGGGVYVSDGIASFLNTIVDNNSARGGGHSSFSGIYSHAFGGGIYIDDAELIFINSICSHNIATAGSSSRGGGIFHSTHDSSDSTILIENSTIAYNNLSGIDNYENIESVIIMNSILYFNNDGGTQLYGNVDVSYSDIQGGFTGTGNINYNPVFYNDVILRIVPGSPCIDQGNPDSYYNDVSFPPSLGGVRNDMGAHGGPRAIGWYDQYVELSLSDCDTVVSPSGKHTWTESGTYNDTMHYNDYYDIIYSVEVSILNSYSTISETFCGSYISPSGKVWTSPGSYYDTIPNSVGCDSILLIDLVEECATATLESSFSSMKAYPNPVNDIFHLELDQEYDDINIEIADMTGRIVMMRSFENSRQIDCDFNFSSGIYCVKISSSCGKNSIIKIIKQ